MKNAQENAARCYSRHALAVEGLLAKVSDHVYDIDAASATWPDAGTMGHVHELMAQLAYACGAITEREAHADHGVTV